MARDSAHQCVGKNVALIGVRAVPPAEERIFRFPRQNQPTTNRAVEDVGKAAREGGQETEQNSYCSELVYLDDACRERRGGPLFAVRSCGHKRTAVLVSPLQGAPYRNRWCF